MTRGQLIGILALTIAPALASAQQARIDSLVSLGKLHLEGGAAAEAAELLEKAIKLDQDQIRIYLLLGRAYLEADKPDKARDAYKEALKLNASSVEAQTGVAEAHYRQASGGFFGSRHARQAVSEAHRATRIDPDYAPAYLILGRSYERLNENYAAAMRAYGEALDLQPEDVETARLFAKAYIEYRRTAGDDQGDSKYFLDKTTLKRLENHLNDPLYLPLAAQIYLDQGEAPKALETYENYIESLPGAEQEYYRDISPVATKSELKIYEQITTEPEKQDFIRQFWTKRDIDILTEVNERLIEHYRRVWYSLSHFGLGKKPWDARGDIYIRYGEPAHRARSGWPAPGMTPAVEQVKERLALALYGPESMDETFVGPVYPVRSNQSFVGELNPAALQRVDFGGNILGSGIILDEDVLLGEAVEGTGEAGEVQQTALEEFQRNQMRPENQHHYLPVTTQGDMTIVPWESWVYTNIGEGIEITFTDELGNSIYTYAPIPDFPDQEGSVGLHRYSQYAYYAPQAIAARAVVEIPEFYTPGGPMSGLGFSYDFADFRSLEGGTRLEVYYAIDPSEMGTFASGDTAAIIADCAVVITDTTYSQVYRAHDAFRFTALGHRKWPSGAFIPNQMSLNIPPGEYLLTVQVNDRASQRKGLYRHRVRVEPYGRDSLQLSDIQLSWNITENGGDSKFRKGDVWVIPMTTRAYREDQSAYVYYELYNLTRNEFGETRYRITYTIGAEDPVRPFNLVRSSVGALAKIFSQKDRAQVEVSLDQTGVDVSTDGYLELDLSKVKGGYNRLTVAVEDLNTGQTTAKEITFRYKQ